MKYTYRQLQDAVNASFGAEVMNDRTLKFWVSIGVLNKPTGKGRHLFFQDEAVKNVIALRKLQYRFGCSLKFFQQNKHVKPAELCRHITNMQQEINKCLGKMRKAKIEMPCILVQYITAQAYWKRDEVLNKNDIVEIIGYLKKEEAKT